MITPLHNHTMYSSLDGLSTPEEIALRCKEIDASCCGITDHGHVAGHLHFAKALKKEGIKPIFGCELYHGLKAGGFKARERDQAHLIALAMTDEGLRNLWCLVDATADPVHFHNVGRVFWEDIERFHKGIVFTSGCGLGLVPKGLVQGDTDALNHYLDLIGDNFYIELSTYPRDVVFEGEFPTTTRINNEALVQFGQERGLPFIYGDDGHFAFPRQWKQHNLYLALQTKQSIYTPVEERKMYHPPDAVVIKDEERVRKALDYLPKSVVDEAIANAIEIGQRAAANLPEVRRHLPMFVPSQCPWLDTVTKKRSAEDLFLDMVEAGIVEKYGEDASQEVWDRALYECETLLRDGIHHYFLMGWDEMQFADHAGISRGPGRGSSAGCIVAYALGITDVDPLHYGLIFERFWNSGRAEGFPDIDSDFSKSRRAEVIAYLKERYGSDRVKAIGTVGRMKPKATIEKLRSGCEITYDEEAELKEIVGRTKDIEIHGPDQIGWSPEFEPGKVIYVKNEVGEEIDAWMLKDPERIEIRATFVGLCEQMCSRVEQYGIHASGILISDVPTAPIIPAYMRGGKAGIPATLFDMEDVDKLQLVKLDVLGLNTLEMLDTWDALVGRKGIKVKWSGLDKEHHPDEMWDLLSDGFTAGIFQMEDGYGAQLCQRMNVRSVDDMGVINALNRPGPIRAKIPDSYLARRSGEEAVDYLDPKLKELIGPVLDPTYGLFVYQEQIIHYFNVLGYDLSESDAMRKIMGKKKPEDLQKVHEGLEEWEGRGYSEMARRAGIAEEAAEQTWTEIEGFASYCFNKSHAIAYGVIGFRAVFAKYYAPAEFYTACIRTAGGEKRELMLPRYVNEARRKAIPVFPPDITKSGALADVNDNDELYFGFNDVKGVGESGFYLEELREEGIDLSNPELFYEQLEGMNKAFLKERTKRRKEGQVYINAATNEPAPEPKSPKQRISANKIQALLDAGAWDTLGEREVTLTERQQFEEAGLGVILTDNSVEVMDRNAEQIAECDPWDELLKPWAAKVTDHDLDPDDTDASLLYDVCGIVSGTKEKRAKKTGKRFGIVTIDYGEHSVEFIVFSKNWIKFKSLFKLRNVCIFTLRHTPAGEYDEGYQFTKGFKLK